VVSKFILIKAILLKTPGVSLCSTTGVLIVAQTGRSMFLTNLYITFGYVMPAKADIQGG
jgi:hypothetical protein